MTTPSTTGLTLPAAVTLNLPTSIFSTKTWRLGVDNALTW